VTASATSTSARPRLARSSTVRRFEATAKTVSAARQHTTATLAAWGLAAVADTAELLASELVTNACRASAGRSAVIAMRLTCTDTDVVVEVWDANQTAPVRRVPGDDAEGGRGLLLVDTLSARWAFYRPRSGGKVVWCSLPLTAPDGVVEERADPLPRRPASSGPAQPAEVFTDLVVLRRVADGLRALDWDLPPGEDARP